MQAEKEKAIMSFASELKERLGNCILGIYLFGSTAKGTASKESDIDILVVYFGLDERYLLEIASEISFEIACAQGESIETVAMSKEEYEASLGRSPFLWEVLKFGKPVFTVLKATVWDLDFKEYTELAQEFLGYATDALRENKLRLAIDTGYNACELLVKALIISTKESLVSSHGGIITQFGKLFVLSGRVEREIGHHLNLALDLRAKARYKPQAKLSLEDAKLIIDLAQKLLGIARKELD